jgi:hypothetical protein
MRVTRAPNDVRLEGVDPATQAALHALRAATPRSLPSAGLGVPNADLLDLWLAAFAVDLHVRDAHLCAEVTARPVACPVARWHAVHGGAITNRWHHEVVLPDPVVRALLARLDGTCDLANLTRFVQGRAPTLTHGDAQRVVDASLDLLAKAALLIG